ncbi:MAG: hypothetical protein HN350_13005, partial [Phycisphaerales bacterium]|nr:hypothetical protein [Phycisphaerales bacterium]
LRADPNATGQFAIKGARAIKARLKLRSANVHRAYLNQKFGRTGNLNVDINARGAAAARANPINAPGGSRYLTSTSSAASRSNLSSWTWKRTARSGVSRTNGQLVQGIGTRADAWAARKGLTGTPQSLGIAKHGYADKLLTRYQRMFGSRGLRAEVRYLDGAPWRTGNPLKGSVRLDVIQGPRAAPTAIWDYKFGEAGLSSSRINQIRAGAGVGSGVPVTEVRPWK